MVDYSTLSIVFTGLSISIAAFYYISTLRNTRRNQELTLRAQEQAVETRQAQLFMEMYRDFKRSDIQQAYNDIVFVWNWDNPEDFDEKYGRRNNCEEFHKYIGVDATILTKVDADVKGGSALSVTYVTQKPILFIGVGQTYNDLELFNPEKFVNMILK